MVRCYHDNAAIRAQKEINGYYWIEECIQLIEPIHFLTIR